MNLTSRVLAERVPFWHFEGDQLVFSDGSIGAGFKLKGFDASVSGAESFNQFAFALENLINTVREGLTLQLYYKVSHDVSVALTKHEDLTRADSGAYKEIADARFEYLRNQAHVGKFFVSEIYLFIRSEANKYQKKRFWEALIRFRGSTNLVPGPSLSVARELSKINNYLKIAEKKRMGKAKFGKAKKRRPRTVSSASPASFR